MNTQTNRNGILLIAMIMAVAATASFFFVPVTPTFLIAYVFTLLAIVMFCGGNLYLISSKRSFPWFIAFPATIWRYLVTQLVVSVVFLLRENLAAGAFPVGLFVAAHIVIFAFFSIFLLLMYSGKEIIEKKDAEVKQKVSVLRMLQADVESLAREHPQHSSSLRQVAEALRYSDPMSNPALALYEEQIQRGIMDMQGMDGNDPANIPQLCEKLLKQIADRNARVKLMK
jgi:FtsZ-binding cell division protein ZapB